MVSRVSSSSTSSSSSSSSSSTSSSSSVREADVGGDPRTYIVQAANRTMVTPRPEYNYLNAVQLSRLPVESSSRNS